MKVASLVIGSELMRGDRQDANSQILANFLKQKGVEYITSVLCADKPQILREQLDSLLPKVDCLFLTGGLGPTKDDVTKAFLATYFGLATKFNPDALRITQANYNKFDRQYERGDNLYAEIPEGFTAVNNPTGYAPGLFYQDQKSQTYIAVAPGVPHEFQSMLQEEFWPRLEQNFDLLQPQEVMTIRTYKVPEEKIFKTLAPNLWSEMEKWGDPFSLPHLFGVDIGLVLSGDKNLNEAYSFFKEYLAETEVGPAIWEYGERSLEEVLIVTAKEKGLTFGFAESCTGGYNGHRLTNIPGCSEVFQGSLVTYANRAKEKTLGVKSQTLEKYGAVSEEVAREMAEGARDALSADIVVSTTGIAGPGGGTTEKPVGRICLGMATKNKTQSQSYTFKGRREILKERFSRAALFSLLEGLKEI